MFHVVIASLLVGAAADVCTGSNYTFTLWLDPHVSSTGYYKVEECGDVANPTLGMELGVEYRFLQHNASNHMHAIGFAYYPDGAHKEVDELEPGIAPTSTSTCADDFSCQSPKYYRDGEYLGDDGEDFGLDVYEPEFFYPRADWREHEYEARLTVSEVPDSGDIFYFCHIHDDMSARIKILEDGVEVNSDDTPELGYSYETPSAFDQTCGTYGVGNYTEDSGVCSDTFLCLDGDETDDQVQFADCLYAVDCQMDYEMRTNLHESSALATFMHQMIPHHINAINMAKLILKLASDELQGEEELTDVMWDIINSQNYQIDIMQAWLDDNGYETEIDAICDLCSDSSAWYKTGETDKDCDWVSNWEPRCNAKGSGSGGVLTTASDACPKACGACSSGAASRFRG